MVATVADPLPPMAAVSAEGQICAADGVVDTEIDGLLQASEQSITRFVRSTQKPQHGLGRYEFIQLCSLKKHEMQLPLHVDQQNLITLGLA